MLDAKSLLKNQRTVCEVEILVLLSWRSQILLQLPGGLYPESLRSVVVITPPRPGVFRTLLEQTTMGIGA